MQLPVINKTYIKYGRNKLRIADKEYSPETYLVSKHVTFSTLAI